MDDLDRLHEEFMKDPEYRAEWERRRPAFELASAMIGIRATAGLTQQELAERTGMSQPAIARLESGAHTPSWATLAAIMDAIGGRVEVSFTGANGKKARIPLPIHTPTRSARSPKPVQDGAKSPAPARMTQRRGPTTLTPAASARRRA